MYYLKWCGCVLKGDAQGTIADTLYSCKRPGHIGKQSFVLNGIDTKKIKKNDLPEDVIVEVLKKKLLGNLFKV